MVNDIKKAVNCIGLAHVSPYTGFPQQEKQDVWMYLSAHQELSTHCFLLLFYFNQSECIVNLLTHYRLYRYCIRNRK